MKPGQSLMRPCHGYRAAQLSRQLPPPMASCFSTPPGASPKDNAAK
jgi:hypothetical protein